MSMTKKQFNSAINLLSISWKSAMEIESSYIYTALMNEIEGMQTVFIAVDASENQSECLSFLWLIAFELRMLSKT